MTTTHSTNDVRVGDRYQDEYGDVFEVQRIDANYIWTKTVRWGVVFKFRPAEIDRMTKTATALS